MTATELLAALQKAPAVLAELAAVGVSVSAAIGGIGTAIEGAGVRLNSLRIEKFGQRLEAIGTDFPKLWRGSRYTNDITAIVDAAAKSLGGGP